MDLKTDFLRGQENAQDDLNENFEIIQNWSENSQIVLGFNETRVSLGADSNYDRRNAVFRRFGPIVLASFDFSLTTAGEAGWKTLMPFPTGYRPAELINVGQTFGTNALKGYWCYVYANTSGFAVIPSGAGTSGKGYQGTLVYMTVEPMPEG